MFSFLFLLSDFFFLHLFCLFHFTFFFFLHYLHNNISNVFFFQFHECGRGCSYTFFRYYLHDNVSIFFSFTGVTEGIFIQSLCDNFSPFRLSPTYAMSVHKTKKGDYGYRWFNSFVVSFFSHDFLNVSQYYSYYIFFFYFFIHIISFK